MYHVTTWLTNNCNTHIAQYLKKGIQEMKFDQLIEYNMRNIFSKIHTQNMVKKIFLETFIKKLNRVYLWINSLKLCNLFLLYANLRAIEIECNQAADYWLLSYIKILKKRSQKLVFLPYFLHDFWRKTFLLLYSIVWPNLIVWLPLIREIMSNMCIAIIC